MEKKELIYIIGNISSIQKKKNELVQELNKWEEYTGLKSPALSDKVSGSFGEFSILDVIETKDNLRFQILSIDIKIDRFLNSLDVISQLERDIIFCMYGKNRKPIKALEYSKKANYYSKSEIYRIKDRALEKMLNYINFNTFAD